MRVERLSFFIKNESEVINYAEVSIDNYWLT